MTFWLLTKIRLYIKDGDVSPRILKKKKCLGFLRKTWYPHTVATALLRNRSGSLGNHLEVINSPSYLPGGKFWYMSYGLSVLTEYVGQQVAGGKNRKPRGRWDRQRKGVSKGMVGGRECKGSLGPKPILSHPPPATLQDSP